MTRLFTLSFEHTVREYCKDLPSGNVYDVYLSEYSNNFVLRGYNEKEGAVWRDFLPYPRTKGELQKVCTTAMNVIDRHEMIWDSPLMKALR